MDSEPSPVPVADALPILVGVVGKRDLAGAARAAFDQRFRTLLDYLDSTLPDTPKLLVCGGAAGADLAAVGCVLGADRMDKSARPGWSVALVLPFDDDNFAQDFDTADFAEDLRYLREDLAGNDRVVRKCMRPLHHDAFDDGRLEPVDAARCTPAELRRPAPGAPRNRARSEHYEQLGLWLARYATLLVAVGPAEVATPDKPHRLGGTARVVAYRRTATPDADAERVIERSAELLSSSPFEEPDGGYVLWLDPTAPAPGETDCLPGMRVLRPIQRVAEVADAATVVSREVEGIYTMPMHDPYDDAAEHRRRGKGALALANAFQRLHARRRGIVWRIGPPRTPPAPPFGDESPAEFLEAVRKGTLHRQQSAAAAWTRRAQRSSALLFFLALAGLETYAELADKAHWLLAGYILLLVGIWAIAKCVGNAKVQVRGEDYRGLQEMLRVQIAWWSGGIDRMVDRVHLRTIDTDLRLVREAAAAVTTWAVLRCRPLDTLDATARPHPKGALTQVTAWIVDQANFFARSAKPQFGAKRLAEFAFELTFVVALLVLALLWLVKSLELAGPERLLPLAPLALAALPLAGMVLAGGVLHRITRRWTGAGRADVPTVALAAATVALVALVEAEAAHRWFAANLSVPHWVLCPLDWAAPLALVAVLGALTARRIPDLKEFDVRPPGLCGWLAATATLAGTVLLGAFAFAPMIERVEPGEAVGKLVVVQAVLLLGGAGMVRWYTERRNHLAQAAQYDDMLRAFRRAQDWLRPRGGASLDRRTKQQLVELGELALDENEAWLKAHRDRPAEPIAGA